MQRCELVINQNDRKLDLEQTCIKHTNTEITNENRTKQNLASCPFPCLGLMWERVDYFYYFYFCKF
jgi:hypothetical protein